MSALWLVWAAGSFLAVGFFLGWLGASVGSGTSRPWLTLVVDVVFVFFLWPLYVFLAVAHLRRSRRI